ncbi:MAG: hypothetical protein IJC01_04300, partial [Clostridia bacterium]|nr:hypothetical protein [Clostridia bacterium]
MARIKSEDMRLRFDFNNMMTEFVGKEQGISKKELANSAELCKQAFATVQANRGKDMMGWSELPYNQTEVVEDIITTA